jgi:hypothetical protein
MSKKILFAGAVLVALAPVGAFAQSGGAAAGATTGAVGGAIVGGPASLTSSSRSSASMS